MEVQDQVRLRKDSETLLRDRGARLETNTSPETQAGEILQSVRPLDSSKERNSYPYKRAVCILLIDTLCALASYSLAYEVAESLRSFFTNDIHIHTTPQGLDKITFIFILPVAILLAFFTTWGHYNRRYPYWTEVRDICKALMYSAAATSLLLFALKMDFSRLWATSFFGLLIIFLPIGRLWSRSLLTKLEIWTKPTVVIGDGPTSFSRAEAFCKDKYIGLQITDYIDISSHARIGNLASFYRYGPDYSSELFGTQNERPHVIVAVEHLSNLQNNKKAFDTVMGACSAMTFIPPISGIPLYNSQLIQPFKADNAVFRLHNNLKRSGSKAVKRLMDIVLCFLGLILLSPIMAVVAVLVKLDGGPVVFGQTRIGQGGKEFTCWKFRSMQVDADERLAKLLQNDQNARKSWEKDHKLKNDPRITAIGSYLRKTSLDELPQFWNVLKGEMSLIGPRPIVAAEITKYGSSYDYYTEARPGITGLWQISGRNDTNYDERVALDVWYVRNWSPWLDLVISVKTIPILLFGDGAY